MKKIESTIRHYKLDAVKQSLVDCGFEGMTVTEVNGLGIDLDLRQSYRGIDDWEDSMPKIKIEIVVPDGRLADAVDAILAGSKTGKADDGELIISELCQAIRIRTAESGELAL